MNERQCLHFYIFDMSILWRPFSPFNCHNITQNYMHISKLFFKFLFILFVLSLFFFPLSFFFLLSFFPLPSFCLFCFRYSFFPLSPFFLLFFFPSPSFFFLFCFRHSFSLVFFPLPSFLFLFSLFSIFWAPIFLRQKAVTDAKIGLY